MKKKTSHILLFCIALLVAAAGFGVASGVEPAFAKAKPKLSKTKLTIEAGASKKLQVKNARQKVKWISSDKKIVKISSKSGKYHQKAVLKAGAKAGSCYVKAKIGAKTLTCRVIVKKTPSPGPGPSPEPMTEFDQAYIDFSVRLLKETLANGEAGTDGNVLVSPDSVMTAMALTQNGAASDTLAQMQQVLSGGLEKDTVNANLKALHKRLSASSTFQYASANSIWTRKGEIDVKPEFLEKNKEFFGADFQEGAFDAETVNQMNDWVSERTNQMIRKILSPDNLLKDSRLVLLNATAFDADWEKQFKDSDVHEDSTFTLADGSTQKVTMLSGSEHTYLELADGGTGFVKNYKGGEVAFLGILPPKGVDAAAYASTLSGKDLAAAWSARRNASVKILLPAFSYDYGTSLKDVLQAMGMTLPFSDDADFSGMYIPRETPPETLQISDVLHKTRIELDQKGTKAAAATAVIIDKASAAYDPDAKKVYLDRPFVYALVDTTTGDPLFLGIVEKVPETEKTGIRPLN